MKEALQSADNSLIMKGKSRHWFWPILAFLVFTAAFEYLSYVVVPILMQSTGAEAREYLPYVLALVKTLAISGSWALLLLVYGIKNNVRTYKILFFILACAQLPDALGTYLSTYNLMKIYAGRYTMNTATTITYTVSGILSYLVLAVWITCLTVFVFSKKTNTALRISAVLLVLYLIYIKIYGFASSFLLQEVINRLGRQSYTWINLLMNMVNSFFYLAAQVFFFAAMSFGKQKQPKITAPSGSLAANP